MKKTNKNAAGFTLLELMMVVALLSIVVGALFSQIQRAPIRYKVEDQKLDLTQQEREFIDQFTRDLHQAGYPNAKVYGNRYNTSRMYVAAGIWSISNTDLHMEGDVDGDGAVESITYSYVASCSCIRRSVVPKADNLAPSAQAAGTAFTEVQNIVAVAGQPIFDAYNAAGTSVVGSTAVTDPATLASIKSVRITLTTQGSVDQDNKKVIQVSMTGMARIVNN